jgi:hypothetical protein
MRDTVNADAGVTPNPRAAAMADSNVGPTSDSEGSAASAGGMGVQDRAPATVLPSAGTMADRVVQAMDADR